MAQALKDQPWVTFRWLYYMAGLMGGGREQELRPCAASSETDFVESVLSFHLAEYRDPTGVASLKQQAPPTALSPLAGPRLCTVYRMAVTPPRRCYCTGCCARTYDLAHLLICPLSLQICGLHNVTGQSLINCLVSQNHGLLVLAWSLKVSCGRG